MSQSTTCVPSTFTEALEDVHTRFILNLPPTELATADRIFFQLEQAWWFYEDWICDPHPHIALPRFTSFKPFAFKMFEYSPLLPDTTKFTTMWNEFSLYKRKISNYGCILLNQDCSKLVLCRVWNGKSYTFPAGKINQGEDGVTAAARETYEETGFDPSCKFGITATWTQRDPSKITWKPLQEKHCIVVTDEKGKRRIMYVLPGVPEDFPFEPVARKEVSLVTWYAIDDVPKPSYAVLPFIGPLRRWIKKHRKGKERSSSTKSRDRTPHSLTSNGRNANSNPKSRITPNRRRNDSRGRMVQSDDELVLSGLASAGEASGWSEEEMFQANERLSGKKIDYDGNPHVFAEHGFMGHDPHAFRVVGGSFLNSPEAVRSDVPRPLSSAVSKISDTAASTIIPSDEEFTPFFSQDGSTPWGDVVEEARYVAGSRNEDPNKTATSHHDPGKEFRIEIPIHLETTILESRHAEWENQRREQFNADIDYVHQWAEKLTKPRSTKIFGEFRLDIDRVMDAVYATLHNSNR